MLLAKAFGMLKFTTLENLTSFRGAEYRSRVEESYSFAKQAGEQSRDRVVLQNGWHCYVKASIIESYWLPKDEASAVDCLRFMHAYTQVANAVARRFGAVLLEVQGKVIHFILPSDVAEEGQIEKFAEVMINALYEALSVKYDEVIRGIKMTAEYGLSVLLTTDGDSIVSLGPSACSPAKRLVDTPAGSLDYRTKDGGVWQSVSLRRSSVTFSKSANFEELKGALAAAAEVAASAFDKGFEVTLSNLEEFYGEEAFVPFSRPVIVRGHYARADMDGFTAMAKEAFAALNQKESISKLVRYFQGATRKADETVQGFGSNKTIPLNWAGDCANFIILPHVDDTFEDSQKYLPAQVGATWFDAFDQSDYRWVLGVAGAEGEGASSGNVLLATIEVGSLTFKIAAGWSVGGSLKAQEASGARNGDTVIPRQDFGKLNDYHSREFKRIVDTDFYRAPKLSASKLQAACASGLAYSGSSSFNPKPHAYCE
jgi:hypothetical protein